MEQLVSEGIFSSFAEKFKSAMSLDAAIVGGGPSGLMAAHDLAKAGKRVALFEGKLAPGGGMWGGAMLFNQIVIQEEALPILEELKIHYESHREGTYLVDSVHATSAMIYRATRAGALIFNNIQVEDVILKDHHVQGLVINWGSVSREGLHVDPLMISSKAVLDGTGHPCEIASILSRKNQVRLNTESGKVMGEMSLDVRRGEETTLKNTKEIYPGLFVSGMAANGVSGSFRMGPIFGGMLLSGRRAAEQILDKIREA